MSKMREGALALATHKWRVLPCQPGGKAPLPQGGVLAASDSVEQIREWWGRWPSANVAVAAGQAVIIDLDPGAEWPADESQRRTIAATGCPLARTPRGGWHLFFRQPAGRQYGPTAGRLAPHVDTRAGHSYVLVAPSRVDGRPYRWVRPLRPIDELPELPAWIVTELDRLAAGRPSAAVGGTPYADHVAATWQQGTRNDGLFRLACRLRRAGLTGDEILAALLEANRARCVPPLPDREVAAIAKSAGRYPAGAGLGEMPYAIRKAWAHAVQHRRKHFRRNYQ